MLKDIVLRNFKCHEAIEFTNLPPLVVLMGRNNSGKSSVLHSATIPKYGWGESAPTGVPDDLLRKGATDGSAVIRFSDLDGEVPIRLSREDAPLVDWQPTGPRPEQMGRALYYLSPLRTPQYGFQYQRYFPDVGTRGETTWNILHQLKANEDPAFARIIKFLRAMGMGTSTITTPTREPGAGEIRPVSFGNPVNLMGNGAGVWSVLPILTQGSLCTAGSTLLVEEPEIHLHRAAINGLWDFVADCLTRGVQVICTSHSFELALAMGDRISNGTLPRGSKLFLMTRNEDGQTSYRERDPTIEQHGRNDLAAALAAFG